MRRTPARVSAPLTTMPELFASAEAETKETADLQLRGAANVEEWTAAKVLVEHLFARGSADIPGIEYAVGYQLAHGFTGGDIVDVYRFDNDAVSFCIADISGKGTEAAINAAMVKYGVRAYASHGLTPECVLRSLDRLYIENNGFERIESFATVFFGVVDASRRLMTYASGGHEAAAIAIPGEPPEMILPTAPLLGVFDDQHHLFKQKHVDLPPGTVFVATTDGITEARSPAGEFYGMERFLETIDVFAEAPTDLIVHELIERARRFSGSNLHDDIAVVAARFV